ncbi:MAG: fimbrillin family protein [Bacteroidales bacterium]|jgi:hypothetical protein|nr:fimbrillin family protein [Bacteroidales bacterium]MDD2264568.1 fimbrillin family protein [Bacteroidales bacterium]MDD2831803.1 fimbrillin family protein [Bacteroidales bacterium]MDD3209328.1 fimbrillin family protein [Bacteroidales bacterium]MDD3697747.1 fimbrillin family protein [Bacteroidales bacterium]
MRKIILAILALIVIAGCVKDLPYKDLPIPIQFNAGLSPVNTRAPIISSGGLPTSPIAGIQILRAADITASPDWSVVASVAATATVATNGSVGSISSTQYYNANPALNAWFMSFYPSGTMGTGKVSWTITGQEDIIVAPSVSAGNKASPVTAALAFAHKLTQLQFKVIAASSTAVTQWGTVSSIKVNADTALELALSTNALAAASAPVNTDLSTSGSFPITLPTVTAADAGLVMVLPGSLNTIKVTTANSPEQTVSISGLTTTVAGSAHLITLTFTELGGITFSATLTDWVTGTGGSGSL